MKKIHKEIALENLWKNHRYEIDLILENKMKIEHLEEEIDRIFSDIQKSYPNSTKKEILEEIDNSV